MWRETPTARRTAAALLTFSAMERRISAKRQPIPIRRCSISRQRSSACAKDKLSVKDGIVSGGGKSISYGDLVKDQQLKLTIPVRGDLTSIMGLTVEGNPPMKPVSEYTVIGKSFTNSVISSKVAAKETWATDVRLPGMLHARMVHPKTLGSTLVSAGQLDKTKFPNSQVIVKGNLVGVVAPTEWEAIQAAGQVADVHQVDGLEGPAGQRETIRLSQRRGGLESHACLKSKATKGDVGPALASAHKKLSATYQLSYMKHAPIGPTMAVADVKPDGTVHIHTHNQNPQALRGEIAHDARHHAGPCDRAFVSRTGPLRQIERRERGRRRRSGDLVTGPRQTGARAVDARRRYAVVHAIGGFLLRCGARARRKRQNRRVSDRPLHARHAG